MKSKQPENSKQPKLGIIIYDTYEEPSDISYTIDSLKNMNYTPYRAKIVITSKHTENTVTYMNMVNQLHELGFYAEFVMNTKNSPKRVIDFDVCKRCLNTDYIVKMEHDSIMNQSFLDRIIDLHQTIGNDTKMIEYKDICAIDFETVNDEYKKDNDFHNMIRRLRSEFLVQNQYEKIG